MPEEMIGFTNEIINGKAKVKISRERSFGTIFPQSSPVTMSAIGEVKMCEIAFSEALSERIYDLAPLQDGRIDASSKFEMKFELTNYELGKVRLTKKATEQLIRNLQYALDNGEW